MKTIFENMFKALNSVIVLFGGEAINFDFNKYYTDIEGWFSDLGIKFSA